jgi:hypothetical protein
MLRWESFVSIHDPYIPQVDSSHVLASSSLIAILFIVIHFTYVGKDNEVHPSISMVAWEVVK